MKYNVGDKVIDKGNIEFFFNPFWSRDKRYYKIVTEANETYFTVYGHSSRYNSAIEEGLSCGMNNYMIFRQSDGSCYSYCDSTKYLHFEKDKDIIVDMIKTIGEKTYQENDAILNARIKQCEDQRERLKNQYETALKISLEFVGYDINNEILSE